MHLLLYLNGILGIYKGIGNRENNIKPIALSLNIIAVTLFLSTLAIGSTFAGSAELNMGAYQLAQQAAQVAQSSTSEGYWTIIFAGQSKTASGFESSSKMITLIIKFDENDVVTDFRSRESNF